MGFNKGDHINLEKRIEDTPHCLGNNQLQYQQVIDPKIATKDAKKFYAYCLVEAENCSYHQLYKNNSYCNKRK